jgi:uncharacterized coiled-coil DUF342 family protein
MTKKQENEPEMIKDSSVTLEIEKLKQDFKEMQKKLADYEKRLKALEAKLA